jgi:hypothetical protein
MRYTTVRCASGRNTSFAHCSACCQTARHCITTCHLVCRASCRRRLRLRRRRASCRRRLRRLRRRLHRRLHRRRLRRLRRRRSQLSTTTSCCGTFVKTGTGYDRPRRLHDAAPNCDRVRPPFSPSARHVRAFSTALHAPEAKSCIVHARTAPCPGRHRARTQATPHVLALLSTLGTRALTCANVMNSRAGGDTVARIDGHSTASIFFFRTRPVVVESGRKVGEKGEKKK